jgi:predicted secreted protein
MMFEKFTERTRNQCQWLGVLTRLVRKQAAQIGKNLIARKFAFFRFIVKWNMRTAAFLPVLAIVLRFNFGRFFPFLLIVLLLPAGCSVSDGLSVNCEVFEDEFDQAAEISVVAGEQFTVTLCSMRNHGYRWPEEAEIDNPEVVATLSHEYEPGRSPMGGIPGKEIWIFQAMEPGKAVIRLEHTQLSGRNTRGVWTYRLAVTVEAATEGGNQ